MPRRCTVCDHPQRQEIDHALVSHASTLRELATTYKLETSSIHRHSRACVPAALRRAEEELANSRAIDLLAFINSYKTTTTTGDRMRDFVRLYREGDEVAIQTNATDETQFVRQVSSAIAEVIEDPKRDLRADVLLGLWLPQVVDLCAKLRGYKAPLVDEQRVLTAGRINPSDALIVAASEVGNGTPVVQAAEA